MGVFVPNVSLTGLWFLNRRMNPLSSPWKALPELSQVSLGFDSFGPSAELNVFATQLLQLDRYERRALSRCRAAIREFDSIMQCR